MRKSVLLLSTLLVVALFGVNKVNAQGLYVPSAYGAWGNTVYAGAASAFPGVYESGYKGDAQAALQAGFGIGNPVKNIGLQAHMNRYSVLQGDRNSFGFKLSRYLGKGWMGAAGMDNIFRRGSSSDRGVNPGGYTLFASISRKLKYAKPASSFVSRLSYTFGVGTGRYASLTSYEISEEMGIEWSDTKRAGTVVFGAVSVDIMKWLDATVEWHGRNAAVGLGSSFNLWKVRGRAIAGLTDLTGFTGDGVRPFAGLSLAYQIKSVKYVELDTKELEEKLDEQHKEILEKTDELKKEHEEILANQKALQDKLDNLESQVKAVETAAQKVAGDNAQYNNGTTAGIAPDGSVIGGGKGGAVNVTDRGTGNYVVVYSRRTLDRAQQMASSLKGKGVNSEITQNKIKSWYHVYTHMYSPSELQTALKKSTEQRRNGYVGAWVLVK